MIHQTLEYTSSVTPSFMRKTQAKPSVDSSDIKKPSLMEEEEDDHETISYEGVGEGGWKLEGLRHRRGGQGKLAEQLFRKDLISAMKLPDTEQLQPEDYVLISDPWRQEWEKGVQVPVSPELIPNTSVQPIPGREKMHGLYGFKLPRKYLHASKDETYQQGVHELHETQKLAEQVCRYDLDNLDVAWLHRVNDERSSMGQQQIEEWVMEKIIEELEAQCHDNMEIMIKTVEGLGIEYDENIICDVCRSPESEDTNEMVFCDGCDICVHQACYGIQKIPEGSWLCRTCALGIRPKCILCPNMGGAMKSTKSGTKWSHVACALWVPEVSIGCPEKMEPITKISQIPSSRWALVCSLCRERTGACIQCSVKTCKTAFHVSCAFRHGLEMKTQLDDKEDDVKLQGFCAKHSKKLTGSPQKDPFTGSPRKEMTEAEKTELRSHRLSKLAEEFYTCVKVPDVAASIQVPEDVVDFIYAYWTLKRKANFNKPLLTPKKEEEDLLSRQQEDSLVARMKMFVHLRQDLERVRNLCYMVTKREKMRRHLYCMKEELFRKQAAIMENQAQPISSRHSKPIITAHHSCGLYDRYDEILLASERGFKEVDLKPMFKDKQARVSVHTLSESLSVNNNDSKWNVPNRRTSINDQLGIGVGKKEQKLEENTPVRNLFGSDYVNSKNCHKPDKTATAVKASPSGEPMDTSCTVVTRGGRVAKRISLTKTECEPVSASATVNTTQTSRSVNSETHSNSQRTDKVNTDKALVTPGRSERNQVNSEKDQVRLARSQAKHDKEQVKSDKSQVKVEEDQGSADKDQYRPEKDVVRTETNRAKADKDQVKPEVTGSPPDKLGTTKGLSKLEREQRRLTTWADLRNEAQGEHVAVSGRRARLSLSDYEAVTQTESKPPRRHSHCIKVANGVIQNSKLVVGESIKEKVQSRLHKAKLSANLTNGVHDAVEKMVKREALASTSGDQRGSLKHLDQLPAQRNNGTRGAVNSVHQSLLSFSPHATLGGYKIPKKSPETKGVNMGHTTPLGKRPLSESGLESPETRSVRRRIEADCESTSSNHQFETVDGEISLRSSRSSTPDIESALRLPKRSSRRSLAQRVAKKLNSDLSHMGSEVSGSTSDIDLGSDSEYAPSEAPSLSSSSTHQSDRASVDALPSHRNHSQARHIDQWSRSLRSNS